MDEHHLPEKTESQQRAGTSAVSKIPPRPVPIPYHFENIPQDMKNDPRWLVWRYEWSEPKDKPGRWTKVPYQCAHIGRHASSTDATTWGTYDQAIHALGFDFDGIGWVIPDDCIGIDYDHIRDPVTGVLSPGVLEEIMSIGSYAEISVSGAGLHCIVRGNAPGPASQQPIRGIYANGRYFTVSGAILPRSPTYINDAAPGSLETIYANMLQEGEERKAATPLVQNPNNGKNAALQKVPSNGSGLADEQIVEKASKAKNAAKFDALYRGDFSGYPSQSEADQALCNMLAFYADSASQIDRIFRSSGLMRDKWDRKDGAGTYGDRTINKALQCVTEHYSPRKEAPTVKRREIVVSTNIPHMTVEALIALRMYDTVVGEVFVRAGEMVVLHFDEERQRVILKEVNEKTLRGILVRAAVWLVLKTNPDGTVDEKETAPPKNVIEDILDYISPHLWGLPVVRGIRENPIIRPNGTIATVPGYDTETGMIYHPTDDLADFSVPDRPTDAQVKEAVTLINDIFGDFPFLGEHDEDIDPKMKDTDRTHVFAALFTHVARPLINGPVPAFLVHKPQPRTGASLLQELVYVILTGQMPTMKTQPRTDEEWNKYITSELAAGTSIVILDNIDRKLKAPALASVITAPAWRDRRLGASEMVSYDNRLFWMLNGNNVILSTDMVPRCFSTRIDAKMARPGEREKFKHPLIRDYVRENRRKILEAVYILVRAWIVKGKPVPERKRRLGSFESWEDTIAGILHVASLNGFMENIDVLYDEADQAATQWDALLYAIHEQYGGASFSVSMLCESIEKSKNGSIAGNRGGELYKLVPDELTEAYEKGQRSFSTALGKAFSRIRDVVYASGVTLKRKDQGAHGGGVLWTVKQTKTEQPVESKQNIPPADPPSPPDDHSTDPGVLTPVPSTSGDDGDVGDVKRLQTHEHPLSDMGWGDGGKHVTTVTIITNPPEAQVPEKSPETAQDVFASLKRYLDLGGIRYVPDIEHYHRINGQKVGRCIFCGCMEAKMWEDLSEMNYLCDTHFQYIKEQVEKAKRGGVP